MPWKQWPHTRGIRGHMFMESVATYPWNTHKAAESPTIALVRNVFLMLFPSLKLVV